MERGRGDSPADSGRLPEACPCPMEPVQVGCGVYKVSALQWALLQLPLNLLVCVQQAGWEGSEICFWLTLGRKAVKPAGFWNVWDLSIETNVKAISVQK